jgi:serine/threonine-protein kinase
MPAPDHPSDQTQKTPPLPGTGPPDEPPTVTWVPGDTVSQAAARPDRVGRYEVRAVLGEGAFGRVYRGFDPELHREVAIKVPLRDGLTPEMRDRFLVEARAAATVRHPNVCPIYDVGTDGDLPYMVMHLVAGPTLAGVLAKRQTPFSPRTAAAVARKVALGIAAAHARGVIHRDLKPHNVLWDEANADVLVSDFGLARIGSESQQTRKGDVLGTPAYMAPEQARGEIAAIGPLSDVYALGVILFQLATGDLPFRGAQMEVMFQHCHTAPPPPSSVRPGLDPRLDAVCLKAMAKEPADRFASAKDFAAALADFLRAGDASEPPSGDGRAGPPPDAPSGATKTLGSMAMPKPPSVDAKAPSGSTKAASVKTTAAPGGPKAPPRPPRPGAAPTRGPGLVWVVAGVAATLLLCCGGIGMVGVVRAILYSGSSQPTSATKYEFKPGGPPAPPPFGDPKSVK